MSTKWIGLSVLVVALGGPGVARAQELAPPAGAADALPLYTPGGVDGPAPNGLGLTQTPAAPQPTTTPGLASDTQQASSVPASGVGAGTPGGGGPLGPPQAVVLGLPSSPYLVYPRSPCCCGPVGGRCGGPLGYELFFRSGIAFPVGGSIFDKYLHDGWDVEGGGRLLFFNQPATKAWTVSVSVSNIFARTGNANQPIHLFNVPVHTTIATPPNPSIPGSVATTTPVITNVPDVTVTVSSLNQTFVNTGFGREWYLLGTADPGAMHGCNWRVGADAGGRYGSGMVQFNEINHHTDVIGGVYCAIHTDVEYPWRCGILQAGIRYEYNYIWTSLLQSQNNGDYQSMNLLFQAGMRF